MGSELGHVAEHFPIATVGAAVAGGERAALLDRPLAPLAERGSVTSPRHPSSLDAVAEAPVVNRGARGARLVTCRSL